MGFTKVQTIDILDETIANIGHLSDSQKHLFIIRNWPERDGLHVVENDDGDTRSLG